jgi:signal transduction histidine kinase
VRRIRNWLRLTWPVAAPLLLCGLLFFLLQEPLNRWLHGDELYDEQAMVEWMREARISNRTLPTLMRELAVSARQGTEKLRQDRAAGHNPDAALHQSKVAHDGKRAEIQVFLRALGAPPTKVYPGQLPLFPVVFRLEVGFEDALHETFDNGLVLDPIVWDSEMPRRKVQYRTMRKDILGNSGVYVRIDFHLHAYQERQLKERERKSAAIRLNWTGLAFAFLAIVWGYVNHLRERQRQQQRLVTEHKVHEAETRHLQEELRRQEAERRHQEGEREILELKSQMLANVSITAGSYAHNIKNLLVRPNDLLRRCLEESPAPQVQAQMLLEVKQTLATVTERLQQILQTVRRDPSKSEPISIDLNALVREIHRTWSDMARDKWKLTVELDLGEEGRPIWIRGDLSHLEQVLENLLFNARDATFEMRNHFREQARRETGNALVPLDASRRQALIAAAGWKGRVILHTRREMGRAVFEVEDIGMNDEVRRRCTEPHFSTKRNNALFAGMSAGMGVGLSFVTVILAHHQARLEIESEPLKGSRFRVRFMEDEKTAIQAAG